MDRNQASLVRRLERELSSNGIDLALEEDGQALVISGEVATEADRQAALDIAHDILAGALDIDEDIAVVGAVPGEMQNADLSESEVAGFRGADLDLAEDESVIPGDYTDQATLAAPADAQGAALSDEDIRLGDRADLTSAGDYVYVPPTDPVGTDTTVIGGFARSSMDAIDVEPSSDGTLGDEAIRDAVLRELLEDAATTGLRIEVEVERGQVRLTGRVADLDDAESAEEVAARVPGVVEVIEELEVEGLEHRPPRG